MTEENYDKDILLKVLEKAREFRKLSSVGESTFNNPSSLDSDMSNHIVKTGKVVQELFALVDEFEASEGVADYLKD